MNSFLRDSRHSKIGIINIYHTVNFALSRITSWDREFMDHSTVLIIFSPQTNRKSLYNYLANIFSRDLIKDLPKIFMLAAEISKFPYICVLPQSKVYDEYSKIRLDIFNSNLILKAPLK